MKILNSIKNISGDFIEHRIFLEDYHEDDKKNIFELCVVSTCSKVLEVISFKVLPVWACVRFTKKQVEALLESVLQEERKNNGILEEKKKESIDFIVRSVIGSLGIGYHHNIGENAPIATIEVRDWDKLRHNIKHLIK
jgi:hypothetical protein